VDAEDRGGHHDSFGGNSSARMALIRPMSYRSRDFDLKG
jgi:hypothetical protein